MILETDLTKAITGTDYFVTTIRVGGDHSRVVDEQIAIKNGVLGQETTGAGGFFMAARSIPVLADYCRRIKDCLLYTSRAKSLRERARLLINIAHPKFRDQLWEAYYERYGKEDQ